MDRLYSTTALIKVLDTLDRPTAWLKNTFFANEIQFTTSEIAFDKLKMRRKLAPFVSPRVAGKARRSRGRQVTTFEPAYVKPLDEISPNENFVRLEGERFAGDLSPEERFQRNTMQKLDDQEKEITRREEWMCAQILQTGKVIVEGEDYPTQEVDFGRDAGLTKHLLTTSRWGESDVKVLPNLRAWATEVAVASGASATQVVLGAEAAEIFQADADVREVLDNRRQASGSMELGPVATGAQDMVAAYLGSIGMFDFWQYTQKYEDDDGNVLDFFPSFGCGLVAPQAHDGMMTYGAIQDNLALRSMQRFPKMWDQQNPSITFLMTQAAPLPVPSDANGSAFIMVR
ncbi:major capsid protein [Stappia sp. ES.058]|uniref:major capsid protein n=1 Tax=Stappia sp. ES.058 TaxID=1881061 RepID=UPI0008796EC8|nr:major capsid protein [Stappia sp. ES.058]SDT97012.1 Phage major capsid protein E [Stappia sp. ES.058]